MATRTDQKFDAQPFWERRENRIVRRALVVIVPAFITMLLIANLYMKTVD